MNFAKVLTTIFEEYLQTTACVVDSDRAISNSFIREFLPATLIMVWIVLIARVNELKKIHEFG